MILTSLKTYPPLALANLSHEHFSVSSEILDTQLANFKQMGAPLGAPICGRLLRPTGAPIHLGKEKDPLTTYTIASKHLFNAFPEEKI